MKGSEKLEELVPRFFVNLFGYKFGVTDSLITQWVVIALLTILSIVLTRDIKLIPNKKQNVTEMYVEMIGNLVKENMGSEYKNFVPFIGTLAIYLVILNAVGLVGAKPPTADYNVTLGLSIVTFIVVQAYAIKKIGLIHYFLGFGKPYAFLAPINIVERVMLPISLSLRLFGNMTAAVVIIDLVYGGLGGIGFIAQIGAPVPLHMYFDIFDGTIQTVIFIMLTMINIKIVSEH